MRAAPWRRHQRLEKIALAPLERRTIGSPSRVSTRTLIDVGNERADRPAARGQVWAENRERIVLARRRDGVDVLLLWLASFEHSASPIFLLAIGRNGAFQISWAYSAIVRSDENQPMFAVFMTLERNHALPVAPAVSTRICAAQ